MQDSHIESNRTRHGDERRVFGFYTPPSIDASSPNFTAPSSSPKQLDFIFGMEFGYRFEVKHKIAFTDDFPCELTRNSVSPSVTEAKTLEMRENL